MEQIFNNFASATAEQSGDVFSVLGIDWKILIFQAIAFGLLVFILAKWIYPPILAMLDRRDKLISDSVKAAKEATEKSEQAAADIEKQLSEARNQAEEIVSSARDQSAQILLDGEKNAELRAEALVSSARAQLDRDVEAARKTLRDETASLVALATEKVIDEKVDNAKDQKLINDSIAKSARKGKS